MILHVSALQNVLPFFWQQGVTFHPKQQCFSAQPESIACLLCRQNLNSCLCKRLLAELLFFLQEKEVNGIKFWCYHAGHVLGAAMFMIEIAGVKVQ